MTEAEKILWRALREANLPHRIRRQHPIGSYIADFAIPGCKLVIEIDGGQDSEAFELDELRTKRIEAHGYRVVRFWNTDVVDNLDGVLQTIAAEVAK